MKFEVLKRSYLKRNIIIGIIVVGIISAVVLNFARAKYRTIQSMPLGNGTINYTPYDLKMVAMYQEENGDYESIDTVPTSGYSLNEEKSYCEVNDTKDNNITIEYQNGVINFLGMTKKGTKCYLYFDKYSLAKEILDKLGLVVNEGTPDFSKTATTDEGVYKSQDDWGDSYYFRGAVNNNWLKFAGFYWRIIRINGDGSIRVIYNGTSTETTGDSTVIESSKIFNSNSNRSEYVGYMYATNQQHGNTTDSLIKDVLDNWYNSNLASYADKISIEAGFCGDREMASGSSWSSEPSSTIYYAAYGRLSDNKTPTLKCSNSSDLYTVSGSSKGNKKLNNPIGLISADEISMAGGAYNISNTNYYLYSNKYYWTMSPYYFDVDRNSNYARVFIVNANGGLYYSHVDWAAPNIRPVINIESNVIISSGNGTSSNPFVLKSLGSFFFFLKFMHLVKTK